MMNEIEKTFAPPNSIIFIADPTRRYSVPEDTGATLVTATSSCIGIGTLAEMDGETTIRLSKNFSSPIGELVFDSMLETPGLRIAVIDSGADPQLVMPVGSGTTHVRIWVNDQNEPDLILIEAR